MPSDIVIIPCAGAGKRLQLPYPKELLAVSPQRLLIDYTFDLLHAHAHHIGIIVVIGPNKMETVRYLEHYQDRFEMAFVYQKPGLRDATGAVLSARSWFGERNIVLLPDQIVFPSPTLGDPIGAAFATLTQSSFCFIATQEDNAERLAEDGALRIVALPAGGHQVVDFADKPGLPAAGFNAVWAGFGFRREQAEDSLKIMYQSACREPITRMVYENSPLYGCPAVFVAGYEDLGTWPRIQRFWASNGEQQ